MNAQLNSCCISQRAQDDIDVESGFSTGCEITDSILAVIELVWHRIGSAECIYNQWVYHVPMAFLSGIRNSKDPFTELSNDG